MSEYGRSSGPRFAQLEDDYKVWAVYCRAQMIEENVRAAVVTDRPASGSGAKSDVAAEAWDLMNEGPWRLSRCRSSRFIFIR